MGYFPNGSSHAHYLEALCTRCLNFRDLADGRGPGSLRGAGSLRGPGCPIIDLHFRWNYDALKDTSKRLALNHFIPIEEDEFGHKTINGDCVMFLPAEGDPE